MLEAWDAGGPCVTVCHKPRQVRKEATVSGPGRVVSTSTLHPRSVVWKDVRPAPFFAFEALLGFPLIHGVFTRKGGVSPSPYDSLNVSLSVGDKALNIRENTNIISRTLGISNLIGVNQVHKDNIFIIEERPRNPKVDADAIITNQFNLGLLIKQADCQGIIIYDKRKHLLSLIHCGWRGNALNIIGKVIRVLKERYRSSPDDMLVSIGPSLGPCCAEYKDWEGLFPEFFRRFRVNDYNFDLKAISIWQMENEGIPSQNITAMDICTSCETALFFSNRREKVTGRFATVACLLDPLSFSSPPS